MQYLVLVLFNSETELADPAGYVEGAVAEMRGCYPPETGERSIYPRSIEAVELTNLPNHQTLGNVYRDMLQQRKGNDEA